MRQLVIILRLLKKNSGLNIINVICMAVGLLSAGIIISYVHQEFNYDNDNLNSRYIYHIIENEGDEYHSYTYGPLAQAFVSDFPEIKNAVRVSFYYGHLPCSSGKIKLNESNVIFADSGFFDLFSFPLIKGDPRECLKSPNSIVISENAAEKFFGNEDPIGKNFQIGKDKEFSITGVFKDFKVNSNFKGELILPLSKISELTQVGIESSWEHNSDIHTFILLDKNSTINDLSEKSKNYLLKFIPDSKIQLSFQPLSEIHINRQIPWDSKSQVNIKYLHTLLLVAILTLSISIVNFLFLFIGSAEKRIIGSGIKKIFGASKPILFLEYLKEVVVLMLISVAFSIVLYFFYHVWVIPYFTFLPEIILFDYKLIILLAGISVLVALLAGIYPSIILSAYNPVGLIKFKGTVKHYKFKLANLLVTVQFTLCIILIVSSIMMNKQTRFMESQNTGYAKDELTTIPLNMHVGEGINNNRFELFSEELKKYPGIKNVSLSFSSPASIITDKADVSWEGKPEGKNVMMNWESISYDYFKTIGITLIQGRSFSPDFPNDIVNWDTRNCSFILNESAVKNMEIADPIGKEFKVWAFHGPIVGVVADYNFKSLHSEIGPVFYMMNPIFFNVIVIRMTRSNHQSIKNIEKVWNIFVPDYPLEIDYVNVQVHSLYKSDQILANILNVFSILTILIACMGLFTLTILSVNHRMKEIGIRKVIGAKIVEVMLMLIKDSIKWVVIAFIIGTPLAWYIINKWLENFAYKTTIDWWIFSLAGLIAIFIALITVSFHSWKAARRNPVEVLRYE